MRKCKLSPDDIKECTCLKKRKDKLVCDIYDEPLEKLKKCPLK